MFFIVVLLVSGGIVFPGVVISEVYQKTKFDTHDQWVELYNDSSVPIEIANYRLSTNWSATGCERVIMPWNAGGGAALTNANVAVDTTIVPAYGYAVILDKDYANEEPFDIPPGSANTIVLTVNGTTLVEGTFSSGKSVVLKDAANIPVDSAGTPGVSDGIPDYGIVNGVSAERISIHAPDAVSNWGASVSASGHTIGRANSLSSLYRGGSAIRLALNPFSGTASVIGIPFAVEIFALTPAGGIDGTCNVRAALSFSEMMDIQFYGALIDYDKSDRSISMTMRNGRSGVFYLRSRHAGTKSVQLSSGAVNGTAMLSVSELSGAGAGRLFFSEIMYANTGSPDYVRILTGALLRTKVRWIELFNSGSTPIDLGGSILQKRSESTASSISEYTLPACSIPAGGYCIIAEKKDDFAAVYGTPCALAEIDFGGLAQEQTLVLLDAAGRPVDVLAYDLASYMSDIVRAGTVNGREMQIADRNCVSLERRSFSRSSLMKENWATR